jgi:cell envelope opacity-associated protein A
MAQRDLLDAFNDCIDRLATGQPLDAVLRVYPHYAEQLAPMLRTAETARAATALPAIEVAAARERVRATLLDTLAEMPPVPAPSPILAPRFRRALAAAAVIVIVGFMGVLLFNRESPPAIIESLTPATETETATNAASETLTATATGTASTTPSVTATGTASPSPSATSSATATSTASETPDTGPTACLKRQPENWVIYRVRSGDTLATLVEAADADTGEVLRVNCLSSVSFLITGSTLYLPRQPFQTFGITPVATSVFVPPTAAPQIAPTTTLDDDDDDDDSGDDDSTDEPDDDDDGGDDG